MGWEGARWAGCRPETVAARKARAGAMPETSHSKGGARHSTGAKCASASELAFPGSRRAGAKGIVCVKRSDTLFGIGDFRHAGLDFREEAGDVGADALDSAL